MYKKKLDLFFGVLIFIISIFLVFDLFINTGQPATFDGTTHITTIAQFHRGQEDGEIRVTWGDGFANYGMPIPLISQQVTPYLGSFLTFITQDVLLSYNFIYFLGAFFSALFYYLFLRIYFTASIAFAGTFLFNFAPYRIINIYIRGAQPELFATVFIPLILIGIYLVIKKRNLLGTLLLSGSIALVILTHPFVFIVSSFLFIPYLIFCLNGEKNKVELLFQITASILIGIGLTAFYTLPLFSEIKYFHYGNNKDHLIPNQYLGLKNLLDPSWYYYYKNDVFVRGNFIKVGLLESIITVIGLVLFIFSRIKNQTHKLFLFSISTSLLLVFLTTVFADILYQKISILNGIQYPWRVLASLNMVTPIILCLILSKLKNKSLFLILIILLVSSIRFPELYGKNYTQYPQTNYYNTAENLHGNVLNTLWTGKTSEYPPKKTKPEIISGEGEIISSTVKNSTRKYTIDAKSNLRMVDNTFYFPGWWVYVDSVRTPIQYQDPDFRGMITYNVPAGKHVVDIKFENTKPRIAGYYLSAFAIVALIAFYLFNKKIIKLFYSVIPKAWHK